MNETTFFRKFIFPIAVFLFPLNIDAQTIIDDPQYFYGCEGDTSIIFPETDPNFNGNSFLWNTPDGTTIIQSDIPFTIPVTTINDTGTYSLGIENNGELAGIYTNLQFQLLETDSAGGKVFPDQIIVQYIDGVTQAFKDSLRMEFEADLIDMCVCGTLELWQLIPDDPIFVNGVPLIDINSKIESLRMNVKSKEVERNRPVENDSAINNNFALTGNNKITWEDTPPPPPPLLFDNCDTIVVAVIDNGIDYNHTGIESTFWYDQLEALTPGTDANENCLTDDVIGWDFSGDDADPISLISGHGTHVAGIIDTTFHNYNNTSTVLEIMPIRTLDENGDGDLFDLICGVLYAKNQQANIINMSLGWQGDSSSILSAVIDNGTNECGPLFIASAGNESTNNDDLKHYPGGYILENIIEVAAIDSTMGDIVVFNTNPDEIHYTNYGESVDLAARGYWVSTVIGDAHEVKEGTSMSAGYITGIVAAMKAAEPHASSTALRDILFTEATQAQSNLDTLIKDGRVVLPFQIPNAISAIQNVETTPCDCLPVGLKETLTNNKKSSWLRAYPNPSNGEVYLDFELAMSGKISLSVFNGHGQVIDNQEFNLSSGKQQVLWNKVTDMPKGIYFFQIKTAAELFVGKVFIQ